MRRDDHPENSTLLVNIQEADFLHLSLVRLLYSRGRPNSLRVSPSPLPVTGHVGRI